VYEAKVSAIAILEREVSNAMRALLVVGWVAGLLLWECKRALRPVVDDKWTRDRRNLAVAGLAAAVTQVLEVPVALAIAGRGAERRQGLLRILPLPPWAKPVAAILLLDYSLYGWHWLTHRVPFLWNFHRVHHLDREMDASTAVRFHFGEIALSVGYRAAQIRVIGVEPREYAAWQGFLMLCILFHHANIRLPLVWERRLAAVLVTPRLHGIHHSVVREEVNSNWSSGLTVWDRLHGTFRADWRAELPEDSPVLGVEGMRGDEDQTLRWALLLPFSR